FIPLALLGNNTYSWTKEYKNKKGNITKRESSAPNGQVYQQDYVYDVKGRLIKESNQYVANVETPLYTLKEYDIYDREVKITSPDNNITSYNYNGFSITKSATGTPAEVFNFNLLGQVINRTIGNIVLDYDYDFGGNLSKIVDPQNGITLLSYDRLSNILSMNDPNRGKTIYEYDLERKLAASTDSRGIKNNFIFDNKRRLIKIVNQDETIEYTYDENGNKDRLTTVKDNSGIVKYSYDGSGRVSNTIRAIDDFKLQFQRKYDKLGRLLQIIYPDNTIATYKYDEDELIEIRVKTSDGSVDDASLVEFQRNIPANKLIKKFGNGVITETEIDASTKLQLNSKTVTARQSIEENKNYVYDINHNITQIVDSINPSKNQIFSYDQFSRLINAKGKYGEEVYSYTDNGNLTHKGDFLLTYGTKPLHAVISLKKPFETVTYSYDDVGNISKRNNDVYKHDSFSRLSEIQKENGEIYNYIYNSNGRRAKKINRTTQEATYYFEDGLYEIHKVPGRSDEHTLYFKDENSAVAQWTRTDAVLPNLDLSAAPITPSPFLSRVEENYNDLAYRIDSVLTQSPNSAYLFLLLIPIVFYLVEKRTFVGYTLSISIVSLIIVTCTSPKKKEFPFAALMASGGITSDTPSVGDSGSASDNGQTTSNGQPNNSGQTTGSTPPNNTNNHPSNNGQTGGNTQLGGGGSSSAGTPVSGFYFLHRDYLDSVTMITNGQGEMVSGMDISTGKSVVDYKPYGEIDRKNSDGPDIFRYKYTGQEEDRETGLYYYKARYYDPEIGRFIEPDTYMNPNTAFGMNQYAYVEGNPIMYNDPSGHSKLSVALKRNGLATKLNFKKSWNWAKRKLGNYLTKPNRRYDRQVFDNMSIIGVRVLLAEQSKWPTYKPVGIYIGQIFITSVGYDGCANSQTRDESEGEPSGDGSDISLPCSPARSHSWSRRVYLRDKSGKKTPTYEEFNNWKEPLSICIVDASGPKKEDVCTLENSGKGLSSLDNDFLGFPFGYGFTINYSRQSESFTTCRGAEQAGAAARSSIQCQAVKN
ncbi:MAG TPA: RHS repeat-associated core domain-containing protein, partial [Leptospiraceae bacterium]|nr:RHS repeat-associated core domain-containing protein [Leptospiraceae bacterium]